MSRRLPDPRRFQPRPDVACPGCGQHPLVGMRWFCGPDGCGTVWDTFETAARCPGCGAQFVWTDCLFCGGRFAHRAWYLDGRSGDEPPPGVFHGSR